jgi:hypothetical protein
MINTKLTITLKNPNSNLNEYVGFNNIIIIGNNLRLMKIVVEEERKK